MCLALVRTLLSYLTLSNPMKWLLVFSFCRCGNVYTFTKRVLQVLGSKLCSLPLHLRLITL